MHGLNGRDPISLLRYEASRRPEVADLLARIDDLTDQDIAEAKVPLPWYRKALTTLRDQNRDSRVRANLELSIEAYIVRGQSADPEGAIVTYTGEDIWVKVRSTELLLKSGTLIFFPEKGGVWLETLFLPNIDPRLLNGRGHGKGTRQSYRVALQEARERACAPVPVADPSNPAASQPLAHLGVRIQR